MWNSVLVTRAMAGERLKRLLQEVTGRGGTLGTQVVSSGSASTLALGCSVCRNRARRSGRPQGQAGGLGSPRSRCRKMWCLVRAGFLISRRPSSRCALTWRGASPPLLLRTPSPSWGLHLPDLIKTSSPPKDPPQLLIPSHWGSGLQQMNLERHTQPMTKPITIKLFFSLPHFSDFLYGSYDFHAVKTPISG